ncbi:TIGR01777 family oxidoreductase [Pseudoxanthomonas sp. PXM02]|uniref:TIGR01777 family oxidoreductase n=1 Tax=Pseudoxanthomonas sp. PXM02 TaxID=2769294 RepID=UPI00177DE1E8|nr:TIGR01777 family oxidoreductase [Pseudoxanthomonas sp. PXM02]MBD9478802.1 TIGR01777 family protein [Pseudoxanthomonas sp. PXM02]
MHVLLTGGTGFIGHALGRHLLQAGHTLSVLTRDPVRARTQLPVAARVLASLDEARDVEAVVNLAGEPLMAGRWNTARKAAFRASRLGTTQALIAWMARQSVRPRVLVSGSAIGYYGPRDDEALDESAAPGDDFAALLCRDWETDAMQAEGLDVRTCRVRTGIVLGNDGGALAKMLPPFRLGLGGPMGDGRQWMSWIHRDDLVRMIAWLLDSDRAGGAYNGTAPTPVTNRDFARTLGKVLRRPAVLPTPAIVLKAGFGEMAQLLLTGQRVLPAHALAEGFAFRFPVLEDALRDLLPG